MKTVGQPRDVAATLGGLHQQIRGDLGQVRAAKRLTWKNDQAVNLPHFAQQTLRHADVGDRGTERCLSSNNHVKVRQLRRSFSIREKLALTRQKAANVCALCRRNRPDASGRCQWFYPYNPHAVQAPLHHRTDQPTRTAQRDVSLLCHRLPVTAHDAVILPFAQGRSGGVITGAGLGVHGLNA